MPFHHLYLKLYSEFLKKSIKNPDNLKKYVDFSDNLSYNIIIQEILNFSEVVTVLVYEKVRQYLKDHGIRQSFVAEKCNISLSTFNAMLNGKRRMYAEDLRKICYALNVSPEVFIEVKGKEA